MESVTHFQKKTIMFRQLNGLYVARLSEQKLWQGES
jgi:hypothetical protein